MGEAMRLLGGLVLEDGRRWVEAAAPFQLEDAAAVLEPDAGAARLHWLGRSKGSSKSTDLAGMSLAWLVEQAQPLDTGYVAASDAEQANRLLDRARGLVARTPALQGVVKVEAWRVLNTKTGASVQALAADVAGAEGVLTPWIAIDELPNWADTTAARGMATALLSSVPKVAGCRLVVIGHAGRPGSWQHRLLEDACADASWRVNDRPGPAPWIDGAALRAQERLLLESEYRRRWLNEWVAAEDKLTTLEDVRACVTPGGGVLPPERGTRYVLGLDLGIKNDRTALSVAHLADDGDVVLDRQEVWQGTRDRPVQLAEVEAVVLEASRSYNRAPLLVDPWQAAQMTQRLRRAGVRVHEVTFSQQQIGRMALVLVRLLRDRQLDLPDDEDLIAELADVRLVERSPGAYRIDHDSGKHDDRVISLALVAQYLVEAGVKMRRRRGVLVYRDGEAGGDVVALSPRDRAFVEQFGGDPKDVA
jgi:phage terminase large subunit-like protein